MEKTFENELLKVLKQRTQIFDLVRIAYSVNERESSFPRKVGAC